MKKSLLMGIWAFSCAAMVNVGCMAVAQAQTSDWNGLYIGPNIGIINNRDTGTDTCVGPGGIFSTGCVAPGSFGVTQKSGGLAGGQIGYNWQFHHLVIGPEVQVDTSTLGGTSAFSGFLPYAGGGGINANFNSAENIGWVAAARLRAGITLGEKSLVYASAGYGRLNGNVLSNYYFPGSGLYYTATQNFQQNGFLAGVGGEWQFQPRTALRLELSEYHFPSLSTYAQSTPFPDAYTAGKQFVFHGYTLTGGVDIKI